MSDQNIRVGTFAAPHTIEKILHVVRIQPALRLDDHRILVRFRGRWKGLLPELRKRRPGRPAPGLGACSVWPPLRALVYRREFETRSSDKQAAFGAVKFDPVAVDAGGQRRLERHFEIAWIL